MIELFFFFAPMVRNNNDTAPLVPGASFYYYFLALYGKATDNHTVCAEKIKHLNAFCNYNIDI